MRVLVTGALGHIGSRLIRHLPEAIPNVQVSMLDDLSSQRYCSLFNLPADGHYSFVEGDILTVDLRPLLAKTDAVIHLAAITDAAGSFKVAERVQSVNLRGTERLAEACLEAKVPIIFPSTTSVYGPQGNLVDETSTELHPQSPYAASKLAGEEVIARLSGQGLAAITFRFGTIFGPSLGMRFHTAVNKFCWQAANNQPLTVWRTALHQKRPYLDIEDAIRAITFALERKLFEGNLLNVVTLNATVHDVLSAIQQHVPRLPVEFVDHEIMNQHSYEVATDRFRSMGFVFRGNLDQGIERTMNLIAPISRSSRT